MDYDNFYQIAAYNIGVRTATAYLFGVALLLIASILRSIIIQSNKETESNGELNKSEYQDLRDMPGPKPMLIIGNLHQLKPQADEPPYAAFTRLAKTYGPVYKLEMGAIKCAVVNELENMREVLIAKGNHFDGRPNFWRYKEIFSGDKENCEYKLWQVF